MTRVLLDAHQLGRRQTGNETYVRELLAHLRDLEDLELVAAVEGRPSPTGPLAPPVVLRTVPKSGLGRLAALAAIARRSRADVVHAIYFLPPASGRPTVVTVHDISFERHPEFFSRRALFRDRTLIRASARMATRVVTVSETSRRDLIELYGIPENRVVAIPNGVDEAFGPTDIWVPYTGDRPFRVLAVGTLQPRKNLMRLVEAVERLSVELPIDLRVIGPDGFQAAAIRDRLSRSFRAQIVGYVTPDRLADAYREADLFVYPSLYEGFGLPVVEAMASGTPVVTSTGGSLPEVAGNAALIVDPESVDALAGAIRSVASDPALAARLRSLGLERARGFSWSATALRHRDVYLDTLGDTAAPSAGARRTGRGRRVGFEQSSSSSPVTKQAASVDYIVVAYRSERHLPACLDSILADRPVGAGIIVVDNASPDHSADVARQHMAGPKVVISPDNLGFGGGCNLAAAASSADLLFFVNPDARLEPGVTEALVETMFDPAVGVAGPRIEDPTGGYRAASAGAEPSIRSGLGHFLLLGRAPVIGRWFPPMQLRAGARSCIVDWVSGAALLVRREAFEAVGGFDPRIFMYLEDVDLCRRLREAGWKARYETGGLVRHDLGGSHAGDQVERWYDGFDAYLTRLHGRPYARLVAVIAAMGLGVRAVVLRSSRPAHARRMSSGARAALRKARGMTHATMTTHQESSPPSDG